MKLEVGMYVRTKSVPHIPSEIAQIIKIDSKYVYLDIDKDGNVVWEYPEYIEKASFNIIDILECGDYVNGCKVHKIGNCLTIILDNEENISWINPDDIKSIVTHEQFEKMSYKLGE